MSHFTVLVIGDDVEKQLAPYHEFECTGRDDEYVQDIDITEEKRAELESDNRPMVRLADGTEVSWGDDVCYRDPTPEEQKKIGPIAGTGCGHGISWTSKDWDDGRGYRTKVRAMPEGAVEFEAKFKSVDQWAKYHGYNVVPFGEQPDTLHDHKYGYILLNADGGIEKAIDRTNPNKKWDWYQIGGRWSGMLKLKSGAVGELGAPGVMGSRHSDGPGRADQAFKVDIDFEGMRNDDAAKQTARWDAVHSVIAGRTWRTWSQVRDRDCKGDIELARKTYNEQEVVREVKNSEKLQKVLSWMDGVDEFACTREECEARARQKAGQTFAVIKDGEWYQGGSMGWWGVVSGEMDDGEWSHQFAEMLDGLPDDTLLTVVDCHI